MENKRRTYWVRRILLILRNDLVVWQAVNECSRLLRVTADTYPHAPCAVRDGREEVEEGDLEEGPVEQSAHAPSELPRRAKTRGDWAYEFLPT